MRPARRLFFIVGAQLLQREFANGLEHPESGCAVGVRAEPDQAACLQVRDAGEGIDGARGHRRGGLQREATFVHGQRAEQRPFVRAEEVVAPGDGLAHAPMPVWGVAESFAQQLHEVAKPVVQGAGWEDGHPGRGQFDRQWETVEMRADVDDVRSRFRGDREAWRDRLGALLEQRDGVPDGKWTNVEDVLPGYLETSTAGGEDGDSGTLGEKVGQEWGRVENVLQVVDHQHQDGIAPGVPNAFDQGFANRLVDTQGVGDGSRQEMRVPHVRQREEDDGVVELVEIAAGHLDREPGLANTAWSGDGHQSPMRIGDHGEEGPGFLVPADERGDGTR